MSRWFEDLLYLADENNRLSHALARGCAFLTLGSIYALVMHPEGWWFFIALGIISTAIGTGLYFLGERNEAKDIAKHRQRLREIARR